MGCNGATSYIREIPSGITKTVTPTGSNGLGAHLQLKCGPSLLYRSTVNANKYKDILLFPLKHSKTDIFDDAQDVNFSNMMVHLVIESNFVSISPFFFFLYLYYTREYCILTNCSLYIVLDAKLSHGE